MPERVLCSAFAPRRNRSPIDSRLTVGSIRAMETIHIDLWRSSTVRYGLSTRAGGAASYMTPSIGKSGCRSPWIVAVALAVVATVPLSAQQPETAKPTPTTQDTGAEKPSAPSPRDIVFDM